MSAVPPISWQNKTAIWVVAVAGVALIGGFTVASLLIRVVGAVVQ